MDGTQLKYFSLALCLSLVFFIAGVAVPAAGVLFFPFVPQPILFWGSRYGKTVAVGAPLAGGLLLLVTAGAEIALVYLVVASMAVFLFLFFGRGWSIEKIVTGTAVGIAALGGAVLWIFFGSLASLRHDIEASLRANLDLSLSLYEKIGLTPEGRELVQQRLPQILEVLMQILPALVLAGLAVVILLNLSLLYRRSPELKGTLLPDADMKEWKAPDGLIWLFIGSGFFVFISEESVVRTVGLNTLILSALFYFFQGLAIVAYYFHRMNVPLLLRGLGYALIVFEQLCTILVVGLGLFDLWGDFRRLNRKDLNPTHAS